MIKQKKVIIMSIFVEKKKNWLQKYFKERKGEAILAAIIATFLIAIAAFIGVTVFNDRDLLFDEKLRNFNPLSDTTIEEIKSNDYTLVSDSQSGVFSYFKDGEKIPLIEGCYDKSILKYKDNGCVSTDDPNVSIDFYKSRSKITKIILHVPEAPKEIHYDFGTKEDGKFYAIPNNYKYIRDMK